MDIDRLKFNANGLCSDFPWQTIEAAPKDEVVILYNGEVAEGSWVNFCDGYGEVNAFVFTRDHHGLDYYYADKCDPQPTHWMPLPSPPTS